MPSKCNKGPPKEPFAVSVWTYLISIPVLAIGAFLYLLGTSPDTAEIHENQSKASNNE